MPKFKTQRVVVRHGTTRMVGDDQPVICAHDYEIHVNSEGAFYTNIPDKLVEAALVLHGKKSNREPYHVQVHDKTLDGLIDKLKEIHEAFLSPDVKVEEVIRFAMKTDVSFAETPDGTIYPHAGYSGAQWTNKDQRYGERGTNSIYGGYQLTIGAKAAKKTTSRYANGSVRVNYGSFYGYDEDGEDLRHSNTEHPAARLNSWTGFQLPHEPREIPYTDDAARFFYNLMLGMAELARRIQDSVFDEKDLLKLIAKQQPLLAPPPKKGE